MVVSTPGVMKFSGWPGVFEPSWRKRLQLVERHRLVAEQMQHRIDQHRAVAGGEHEAVAVGPRRVGRIELEEAREQDRGDVGGAHGQAGMAGFRLFDRIHGERADRIRHAIVHSAGRRRDSGGGGFCGHGEGRVSGVNITRGRGVKAVPGYPRPLCIGREIRAIARPPH